MLTAAIKLKTLAPWKKNYDNLGGKLKKQRYLFANNSLLTKEYSHNLTVENSFIWWECLGL